MPSFLNGLPVAALLLIGLLVAALSTAVYAWVSSRQRRQVLMRIEGSGADVSMAPPLLAPPEKSFVDRLGEWVSERVPESWSDSTGASDKLLQAGFESRTAAVLYASIRVVVGLMVPLGVFVWVSGRSQMDILMYVGIATAIGLLGPPAGLDRLVQRRRDKLRRALPDALDLLVVCVEAGVSLDAAILRVARDIGSAHDDLANELLIINRKVNAGMPREQALYGLWTRTGVEELRALSANMVQSERWGTSIAKVLRVNAEVLRRKRKQYAEKKAAQASLKMMGPLLLFLLPALFVVILGPAFLKISEGFGAAFK
jgi:tight adherence protein C